MPKITIETDNLLRKLSDYNVSDKDTKEIISSLSNDDVNKSLEHKLFVIFLLGIAFSVMVSVSISTFFMAKNRIEDHHLIRELSSRVNKIEIDKKA